jgi:hypothetical protein
MPDTTKRRRRCIIGCKRPRGFGELNRQLDARRSVSYAPTGDSRAMQPVIRALVEWGNRRLEQARAARAPKAGGWVSGNRLSNIADKAAKMAEILAPLRFNRIFRNAAAPHGTLPGRR